MGGDEILNRVPPRSHRRTRTPSARVFWNPTGSSGGWGGSSCSASSLADCDCLRFPLWDDESFLCVNFIHRSYAELLKPLDSHHVAPILFLWVERTAVWLFGYSELALRLFPLACSIAGVFLFRRVASKLLSGTALLLAVAVFAVSYPGIRYAAEAKQYGSDMFVSLAVLALVIEWRNAAKTAGCGFSRA